MSALADRCEKATGDQQREMIDAAFIAIHGERPPRIHGGSEEMDAYLALRNPFFRLLEAGGFLDAAMTLVPEDLAIDQRRRPLLKSPRNEAVLYDGMGAVGQGHGATPALALCAAALRARAGASHEGR